MRGYTYDHGPKPFSQDGLERRFVDAVVSVQVTSLLVLLESAATARPRPAHRATDSHQVREAMSTMKENHAQAMCAV